MRKLALVLAIAWAAPAVADKTQATQLLVDNLVARGQDPSVVEAIARCFTDRMTDSQAAAYFAARTEDEQLVILAPLLENTEVSLCLQQAMGG